MATKASYEFGQFRLDPEARILLNNGKVISLTPKVVELLIALVEKAGQVIPKDDLMKAVWPDTFVEEGNLTSNISILRKQLGTRPEGGEYIETIPKRGYRFVATVNTPEPLPSTEPLPEVDALKVKRSLSWTALFVTAGMLLAMMLYFVLPRYILPRLGPSARIDALAVLPLTNLSGNPAEEFFVDGMTDALIADLAQIGSLRVASRNSVMKFKRTTLLLPEIARQLKVDGIVSGSVFRSGQRVRIIAELIQVSTDRRLWTKTYDRNLGDVLDLQNEVARAIASEVHAKVSPQEKMRLARNPVVDGKAYEPYLKGRYYVNNYTGESLLKSVAYFQQAIDADPAYAAAYAGLAEAYLALQYSGASSPEEVHPKALRAVAKALELDDNLGEAHAAMAVLKAHEWDWAGAESECKRAFDLNPGSARAHWAYSNELRHRGRLDESIAEAKRALELDPLSPLTNEGLADAYRSARQYDLAIQQYQKTLELYPGQASSRDSLGWVYVYKGLYDQGVAEIRKSYNEDPNLSPELAYIFAMRGDKAKAEKILERLLRVSKRSPVEPHHFALIYTGLGMNDEALVMLEQAYRQHSPMMTWLKVDPRFDSLRPHPRFQDLMRRVGLL